MKTGFQAVSRRLQILRNVSVLAVMAMVSPSYGQSVNVSNLSGNQVQGELKALDDGSVSVAPDNGDAITLPTNELSYLTVNGVEPNRKDEELIRVQLADGSMLVVTDISGSSSGWNLKTDLQADELQLPGEVVSSLQFISLTEQAQKSWAALMQNERSSDVLTVLREGDLESLNGAILKITPEAVEFEMDGQTIQAPRAKVAGLIWFRRNAPTVTKATEFMDSNGSTLRLKSLKLGSDAEIKAFDLTTISGIHLKVPIEKTLRIDYSAANLQWLDKLEVLESVSLSSIVSDTLKEIRDKLLAPKFIATVNDTGLADPDPTRTNLVFDGPGRFVFRVPDGYTRLVTTVQRRGSAKVILPLVVSIKSDDKEIWNQKLDGEQLRLDVLAKVEPNKKCEISVICEGPIPFGSYTVLIHPHLLP